MTAEGDTLKRTALLHSRAVECVQQALDEKARNWGWKAEDLARAILARLAALPDPILLTTHSEMEARVKGRNGCEGCGVHGNVELTRINVTNGVLTLCRTCLDDVNRKNPELARLKLLLIRKSEALALFGSYAMWSPAKCGADPFMLVWEGKNNPIDFARREAEADTPDNRGEGPTQ